LANLNRIILIGRLTADPEGRTTTDGLAVTKFRLAVERPVAAAQKEENVDLVDIVTWQRLAEVCSQYLKKGRLVLVEGRIQNRSFEDQSGQRRWVTEVVASNMTMLDKGSATGNQSTVTSEQPAVAGKQSVAETIDDAELESDLPF
jgi:single-strand DNA-binding protein